MINNIILATQSNSRIDLIKKYNLKWKCVKNKFDETEYKKSIKVINTIEGICDLTKDLAFNKAFSVKNDYKNSYIIGCDTIVLCENKLLEKPNSLLEAKEMIDFLQNKIQYCITGICIYDTSNNKYITFSEITKLRFNNFTNKEYNYLLNETNPLENSGAYEYNEVIAPKVDILDGVIDNIIGIPVQKVIDNINIMKKNTL